jgi:eukaryotic-like serine/threonine-protein kinase
VNTAARASQAERPGEDTRLSEGALTALLRDLASAPVVEDAAWARGLVPGAIIGRFELLQEIGRGGFGVVFEAHDRELGRRVAFKALRATPRARAALAKGWLADEAEAVARLNHPSIVTLYDVGRCEVGPYLILELLRGETLEARLARGPLPAPEAAAVAAAVAAGLAHAHAAGVVHRDLKPANVFLCWGGAVKILDFGIAHVFGRDLKSAGTPAFMAPEQRQGVAEGPEVDVYAAGALLLAMLGGKPPAEPGEVPALPAATPAALAEVIGRTLQVEPSRRPRDGAALAKALRAAEEHLPGSRRRALRRGVTLAAALALAVAAGGISGRMWSRSRAPAGPVAVAVADFANETGEPDLDGLAGLLGTSLEQSRALQVVTRARLLEVARQQGRDARQADAALAREVGKAAGVRALVLGSLRREGAGYALALEAIDPASGRSLFTLSERAPARDGLAALVDRASTRIRRELRERLEDVRASEVQVAQAITGSLEAYQLYAQGEQCADRVARVGLSSVEECADHFRRALAVDPTFALAHHALAIAPPHGRLAGEEERAHESAALRYIDRVPEKERFLIRGWAAHLDGRDEEALAIYRTAAERFPRETKVLLAVGQLLHDRGDHAEALPWLERVLALDPTHGWALEYLVDDLGHLGRTADLRHRAAELEKLPRQPSVLHALSVARGWAGDAAGAAEAARSGLSAGGGTTAQEDLLRALVMAGRLEEAEAHLRAAVAASPADPWSKLDLASVLALQGRRREGIAVLRSLGLGGPDGEARDRHFRVAYLAGDGAAAVEAEARGRMDSPEAPKLAALLAYVGLGPASDALAARLPPGSLPARMHAAVRAWRAGQLGAALRELAELERIDRAPGYTPAPAFFAAEVALEARRPELAVAAVERLQALYVPTRLWRSWAYPRSFIVLALAEAQRGRTSEARQALARFFESWRKADADAPLLREARALERSLAP